MIIGIGVDIVQNSRIKKALSTHKLKFMKKILTKEELSKMKEGKILIQSLCGIFAAKEAVIKSLTAYLGFSLNFQEIIIEKGSEPVPKIKIFNYKVEEKLSNVKLTISISHEKYYSIALAVAEII